MTKKSRSLDDKTRVTTLGRDPHANFGAVNPPVYHASTLLYPNYADLEAGKYPASPYGRMGTPGTFALQDALSELEGAYGCRLTPSGQSAVTTALIACLVPGNHLLMVDSVYEPVRMFCDRVLKKRGIEITYYDPNLGADIAELFTEKTAVVFCESPGSLTFEVQDIPAISKAAHAHGALVLFDNTWGTPLHFKAFNHGVDISIHALTKYVTGHADCMLGAINYTKAVAPNLEMTYRSLGLCAAPDDVYLALRGLRTLAIRLEKHQATALELGKWLQSRPEVARVLNPALPGDPGHKLWQRDFLGANGLFGVELKSGTYDQLEALFDTLDLFGMGFSWGGFESLMVPSKLKTSRTATTSLPTGPLLRIHAGLESPGDLIADLERGFDAFNAVS